MYSVRHQPIDLRYPGSGARVVTKIRIRRVVDAKIVQGVRIHHLEVGLPIDQGWRVKACISNPASFRVARRIEYRDVEFLVTLFEQLAHSCVGKAEDRLEVSALSHLSFGDDLLAVF